MVLVTKDETTIEDGGGDAEQIAGRVSQIRSERRRTRTTTGRSCRSGRPIWPVALR
jgi:hypothetical protein